VKSCLNLLYHDSHSWEARNHRPRGGNVEKNRLRRPPLQSPGIGYVLTGATRYGCFPVQECIAETQDWRKCQEQVSSFKKCMLEYERKKKQGLV
jgi:hypothetical protein